MYMCIYVYVHVIYVYVHVWMYICMCACIDAYICTCTNIFETQSPCVAMAGLELVTKVLLHKLCN